MRSTGDSRFPHLVLGGCRSGKSCYAEQLIRALKPPYFYIATARILDEEMEQRVNEHRRRRGTEWRTLECPLELAATLKALKNDNSPVLVDCLTAWLSNLLVEEDHLKARRAAFELCEVVPSLGYPLVLVADEVGSGIVPESPLARTFRDIAGLLNQRLAAVCPQVTLIVAGIPLRLKPQRHPSCSLEHP